MKKIHAESVKKKKSKRFYFYRRYFIDRRCSLCCRLRIFLRTDEQWAG
jgi:hypothetical protein